MNSIPSKEDFYTLSNLRVFPSVYSLDWLLDVTRLHLLAGSQAEQAGLSLNPPRLLPDALAPTQELVSLIQSKFNPYSCAPCSALSQVSLLYSILAFMRPMSCEDLSLMQLVICLLLQPSCGEETK